MRFSAEGTAGLALALVLGLAAGAATMWPEHRVIGAVAMVACTVGLIGLAVHHGTGLARDNRKKLLPFAFMLLTGSAFIGCTVWYALVSRTIPAEASSAAPTADQIASAYAEKTRVRDMFSRQLDRPITSMYVVMTLDKQMTPGELSDIVGIVFVGGQEENSDSLYFGVRPDTDKWTEQPGNKIIEFPVERSFVWTFPRMAKQDSVPDVIDRFSVSHFDTLDRLEIGAIMSTPFNVVSDLDHAAVGVQGTEQFFDHIERISVIANDYIIFDLSKSEISGRTPRSPVMSGIAMVRSHVDQETGQIIRDKVTPLPPARTDTYLPNEMKGYPLFMVDLVAGKAKSPIMPHIASIDFANTTVRTLNASTSGLSLAPRKAGSGSMTIVPGEHGWLPRDPGA